MVTKDELMEAARYLSAQQETLRCMGMMNSPEKLEDRVEQQAAYRVQTDVVATLQRAYNELLDGYALPRCKEG